MKSILSRLVVAAFALVSFQSLNAQVVVNPSTLPSVSISISGGSGPGATQVLANDLKRTGMIAPISTGGEFAAAGTADASGVSGSLVNRHTGQTLFNETFTGSTREATHQFADAITKAVTGLPGFASSKIAFVSGKELWYGDIDGYNTRAITHDGVICASPALSRDGSHLAYTSYKSGYPDVYVIDLGSGSRNRVAYFPGINSGPSFSPDGASLALTLSKDGNPEIYTLGVDGSSPNRITRTRGDETSPSWSPDGNQLVFSSDENGSPQLYIASSQGGGDWDHLVTGNTYCTKPDWSPDGKKIAFTARIGGVFQIGVFDLATRTGTLISRGGGEDPAWTRDSRHLVYSNDHRLYLLDTHTGNSLSIPAAAPTGTEPTVSR